VVNFCLSSGLSVLAVFVSFLCAILASAFYKYTTSREQMLSDDITYNVVDNDKKDLDKPITMTSTTELLITSSSSSLPPPPPTTTNGSNDTNDIQSLEEIEVCVDENPSDQESNHDEISDDILIDTIEGTEEEIQKKQIANIYRLLNDQNLINNWTTTDFLDQLKMYGLETYDENELELI
jgi:hypothetical protein